MFEEKSMANIACSDARHIRLAASTIIRKALTLGTFLKSRLQLGRAYLAYAKNDNTITAIVIGGIM